jgi:hypothetical protein
LIGWGCERRTEIHRHDRKGLVLAMINTAPDDAVRKQRILIARQEGILSDQEAEDWLAILELRAA